jgi:uncharacterized iron-regulated protein
MRLFSFFFLIVLYPYLSLAQVSGTDYKLYDSHLKKETTVEQIAGELKKGEILVLGEQHDDSIGHLMEQKMFEVLYSKHNSHVILAMEMFHRDVQYILDEYLAGQISEKNFIKEARAWDTYKTDYRSAIEFAKSKGLKVVAANTPSRYANMVTRRGLESLNELSKAVRKNYLPPLPVDTMKGEYYEKFLEAMGGHSMPGMNLYQSQNLWDATMSWSIVRALKKDKEGIVFMMNGRFHSDNHLGFVKRLTNDYNKKVTTISCFAAEDFENPDWTKYQQLADYIILTRPKAKDKDAGQ